MCPFTLSAKSIKNYTTRYLNYELTSGSFEYLNKEIKNVEGDAEKVDEWLRMVLEEAKKTKKSVIRRKDIEIIVSKIEDTSQSIEVSTESETSEESNVSEVISSDDFSQEEHQTFIEITQLPSMGQAEIIEELESEVDRLKKIIQIILNKQAELV